jgi:hypothetical protein
MLEKLIKLYAAYMTFGTTGLMPHLVGPPGSGKSSVIEELAELVGAELHVINVSRLSPLEVEGVQMPVGEGTAMVLTMLPATFWTRLKDGDIILFDEFLRGFPEVYNALLDIFTSRKVGAFPLPRVFMIGASNSIAAYDEALEDRLLHIPVADPRKRLTERKRLGRMIVELTGIHPATVDSNEMSELLDKAVLPTFDVLDALLDKKSRKVETPKLGGRSVRNLISQVQLRYLVTPELKELIEDSNLRAETESKLQYLVLLGNEKNIGRFGKNLHQLVGNPKLTKVQRKNLELNLQLIELAEARKENDDDE